MAERKIRKTIKEYIAQNDLKAPKKLKILVTVVDRSKADFYATALEDFEVNAQTIVYAQGTAGHGVLSIIGLENDEKAVILSVVQEDKVPEILTAYEDRFFKTRNGNGIAFTLPIDSMIGVMVYRFLANVEV